MAVRSSRRVATAGGRDQAMHTSTQSAQVPGQLIIRFKTSAVQHVAAQSVSRRARTLAAAVPDEIAGPLSMLKERAGMRALKPLFVPAGEGPKPQPNVMAAAGIHRALARSATDAARPALTGYQLVELKGKKVSPALLKKLRASKAVDFVEPVPNRWLSAADPLVNRQWGLRAIRWFDGQHPDAAAVHVAVLDSGVDEGHPDLKDAIEQYRHDGTKARDFLGHGTHVSGTIAAIVNNSVGVAGVANCRLHCWKVFEDPPAGSDDPDFNFEFYSTALASALDTDIKVINLSIGGTERSRAEAAVFAELRAAGVIAVAAMGNEFEDGNPGVSILSTVPRVKALLADKTDYDSWPGTSMATPHVAGAAALLYASRTRSKEAADDIVKRLTSTAKKVAAMKKKAFTKEYGAGLLNVAAALKGA
jgi:subtilisin family serine protease